MPCIVAAPPGGVAPAGMTRNAATPLSTTLAQIDGWVAEAGSVVTGGNALIASGSGMGVITSSVPFTNSGINRTIDVEIRVNGVAVASVTGASVPGGGATINLSTPGPVAIPDGAQITYWARQSGGTLQVANSAAAYVRITPA
ncbi:hypothetical protein [Nocardia farcinica]|uniref:Uncharacterized protein n=1 Tax=Nocardia farcinica (strain IFM 10152) TaxID=247156 RepID=Q5Z3T6_NOCFA|nr:hypothetical protein [Nocardia farcinica]BAD54905.1 hypothetical protein NFA_630 [Nocardia farcinica IFM 10152]